MTEQTTALSPYACAGVVNNWLKEQGEAKKLPPQMFYTYVRKNYIPSTTNEAGKPCVSREDLRTWFDTKYKKSAKKTSAEVVADNDGTVGEW